MSEDVVFHGTFCFYKRVVLGEGTMIRKMVSYRKRSSGLELIIVEKADVQQKVPAKRKKKQHIT